MAFSISNPFNRDTEETKRNIMAYKVVTILTFAVNLVFTLMYLGGPPHDGHHKRNHTIFGQSNLHQTPFTISHVFVSIYWAILFAFQIGYIWHLFSSNEATKKAAASVGAHFILFNLLQFAWLMFWVRSYFWPAEIMMTLNFLHMASLYFKNPATPKFIHTPAVTMPLTWTFFGTFWFGAVAVHCHGLACRILANIAVWSILVYGGFFLMVFKDYTIGFSTSFLAAGLGVGQFFTKIIALQWIFAFAIMAAVFIFTLTVAIPGIFGARTGAESDNADRERAPLLQDS